MSERYLVPIAVLIACASAWGEPALPAFEAATIKPSQAMTGGNQVGVSGETLTMTNVTLRICLKLAYDLQDSQIAGPAFLDIDRFDIVARAGAPFSSPLQMKQMIQSLMIDRFHLTLHRETREVTAYALVAGKGGPKFQHSQGDGRPSMNGKGTLVAQFASMKMLADFLSGPMKRPVQDATGLTGQYDFKLDLMQYLPTDLAPSQEPDVAGMVLNALENELGLKLESSRAPMEVTVIDHAEKPSAN